MMNRESYSLEKYQKIELENIMIANLADLSSSMGFMGKMLNVLASPFNKTLSQGASTTVYCAVHPETKGVSKE